MANVKITSLTSLASADVDVADVFVIDDVSETQTKKITVANLRAAVAVSYTHLRAHET